MKPVLLRPNTVAAEYDMSRRTVHRLMQDPDFPQPIRLTARTLLYRRSELEAFFERRRKKHPTTEPNNA